MQNEQKYAFITSSKVTGHVWYVLQNTITNGDMYPNSATANQNEKARAMTSST